MTTLMAIDPGIRLVGWAWFVLGKLSACGIDHPDRITLFGDTTVIEKPQVYRALRSKGDPNDLIDVAVIVGELKRQAKLRTPPSRIETPKPAEWKRQVDKAIHHRRIMKVLTDDERRIVPQLPKKVHHNMVDAIGIGLAHLERLEKYRGQPASWFKRP